MSYDVDTFNKTVAGALPALAGIKQKAGIEAIIKGFQKRLAGGDPRWLAYVLATAYHETAATMQPVREAFWLSENWRKTNLSYYPYYGRGYVQLTHKGNYANAGDYVGRDLVAEPDLAMDPAIAAEVMFVGMTEGWFRGDSAGRHTLKRYFSDTADDPVGSRNIINGKEVKQIGGKTVTVASIIADYHAIFLKGLKAAAATEDVAGAAFTTTTEVPTAFNTTAPSARFVEEREILLTLAEPLGISAMVDHMVDLRDTKHPSSHPRYWAAIDFRRRSDEKRLHVFDIEARTVSSYLCAHGKGSDPDNDGIATSFSNVDGSNKSSLGIYRCAETYFGIHGYSMRLDGLEPSNDNARHRAIVVHPADYVSDAFVAANGRVGRSLGCPAVDAAYSQTIIDQLKLGSFLIAWAE